LKSIVIQSNGQPRQAGATDAEGETIRKLKTVSETSLYVFAKAILGWDKFTPAFHKPLCEQIQTIPPRRKGFLLPRGHFKTTCAKSLVIHGTIQPADRNIYIPGVAGTEMRICYMCKTTDRAASRLRAIRTTYETNELLRAFWPEVVWEDIATAKTKWNDERLLLKRASTFDECTIEQTGTNASITGGHFDWMIKDDLIDIKDRNEPSTMASSIDWNHASYSLANDPETVLEWYFGTHWGVADLYTDVEAIDPFDPATGEGVRWWKRSVVENGVPVFPERFSLARIARLKAINEDLFYFNYMNTIVGSKMQDFHMAEVRGFVMDQDYVSFTEHEVDPDLKQLFGDDDDGNKPARTDAEADFYRRLGRH